MLRIRYHRRVIPDEVAAFVEGGDVAIWLAVADVEHVPQTTRSMGARVDRATGRLRLFLPAEQGARAIAVARVGATLAVTFVRIHDYRAVQVKGEIADIGACDDAEPGPEQYRDAFTEASARVGVPRELTAQMVCRPCTTIGVIVRELYAQTPGPNAGARL